MLVIRKAEALLFLLFLLPLHLIGQMNNKVLPDDDGHIEKVALHLSSYLRQGDKPLDDLTDILEQIPIGDDYQAPWDVYVFHQILDNEGGGSFNKLLDKNGIISSFVGSNITDNNWVNAESILLQLEAIQKENINKGTAMLPELNALQVSIKQHVKAYAKFGVLSRQVLYKTFDPGDISVNQTICKFSDYLQDDIHIFYNKLDSINTLVPTETECENYGINKIGSALGVKVDASRHLPIQGGNMLVSTDFALIGRNSLESTFADGTDWCKSNNLPTGLPTSQHTRNVSTILADLILGSDNPNSIIWVGNNVSMEDRFPFLMLENCCIWSDFTADTYFQPFYHIDLFLSLLGETTNSYGKSNGIYYLLAAVPDTSLQHFFGPSNNADSRANNFRKANKLVETLQAEIREVYQSVRDSIQALFDVNGTDLKVKVVEIPMPLDFGPEGQNDVRLQTTYSYVNGLVSKNGNQTTLYLPKSPATKIGVGQVDTVAFYQKLDDAISQLKDVEVKFVTSEKYDERSGLRCLTKVIGRQ